MWLTPEQLADLTGYVQGAAQIRWLRKNGIDHTVRADGKPRVPAVAFTSTRTAPAPRGPNLDAVRIRH